MSHATTVTNADLMRRLSDLEVGISGIAAQLDVHERCQQDHERRLGTLESDREWLRATVLRLVDSVDVVRQTVTLLAQRAEAGDRDERQLAREVHALNDELRRHLAAAKGESNA